MAEIELMVAHYDQVLNGDPWYGDPMWRVLDGITAKAAAARPLPQAHTIWEIVMHMIFWEGVVIKRLHGQRAGLVEELNFPAMPEATEENWQKTLEELRTSNRSFREALEKLDPAKLAELTVARKRTYAEEAQGIIEHHVYHVGQIGMLRKAQG